jgi:steroid delta-isomerase-like uncharacterized protein
MGETEERNIRLVMEHFAAESRHDYAATLATLADDIEYRIVPAGLTLHGKEGATRYYDQWWKAFPDVKIEIQRVSAAGEWVVVEAVSTATHLGPFLGIPPTGKTVRAQVCCLIRVRDGKMVEETVYYDQLERLAQIGSTLEVDGRRVEWPQPAAAR